MELDLVALSRDTCTLDVLSTLEEQLAVLDALGANKAAAHLDAAIQQLRHDQARR